MADDSCDGVMQRSTKRLRAGVTHAGSSGPALLPPPFHPADVARSPAHAQKKASFLLSRGKKNIELLDRVYPLFRILKMSPRPDSNLGVTLYSQRQQRAIDIEELEWMRAALRAWQRQGEQPSPWRRCRRWRPRRATRRPRWRYRPTSWWRRKPSPRWSRWPFRRQRCSCWQQGR